VTLFRQLLSAILVGMLLLYIGNVSVGLSNGKSLVEHQMRTHAQDTANSIALSMTPSVGSEDVAALNTILTSVSDNGFYRRIYFQDVDGKLILERDFVGAAHAAPGWFVSLISLSTFEGVAEVSAGWVKQGSVVVVNHPGHAYTDLWHLALEQLVWFAIVSVAVGLLLWLAIGRLLAPLQALEVQVYNIVARTLSNRPLCLVHENWRAWFLR